MVQTLLQTQSPASRGVIYLPSASSPVTGDISDLYLVVMTLYLARHKGPLTQAIPGRRAADGTVTS